jgi:hypothetical protein
MRSVLQGKMQDIRQGLKALFRRVKCLIFKGILQRKFFCVVRRGLEVGAKLCPNATPAI